MNLRVREDAWSWRRSILSDPKESKKEESRLTQQHGSLKGVFGQCGVITSLKTTDDIRSVTCNTFKACRKHHHLDHIVELQILKEVINAHDTPLDFRVVVALNSIHNLASVSADYNREKKDVIMLGLARIRDSKRVLNFVQQEFLNRICVDMRRAMVACRVLPHWP